MGASFSWTQIITNLDFGYRSLKITNLYVEKKLYKITNLFVEKKSSILFSI